MTLTTFLTLLSLVSAVFSVIGAYVVMRFGSVARLSRRFDQLQLHLGELAGSVEHQEAALMNLRSRITMQATRSKRGTEAAGGSPASSASSDDSAKADVRRQLGAALANGSIKTPGR